MQRWFFIPGFLALALAALLAGSIVPRAEAALRSAPGWWDPDGVGSGSDWHYRVAVTLPASSSVNSTARIDIDFAALMNQLGVSGTFDPASVRVVRPGGGLAAVQEFNRTIYGGTSNAVTTRGEVRWIVEDGGAQTYQVYFDITQNGTKPANPQPVINGNFEHSSAGTQLPSGWASATRAHPDYDLQVRPAETVNVTSDAGPLHNPRNTDGNPRTGGFAYLLGARTNIEPVVAGAWTESTVLTRQIVVPATNPGNLTIRWRPEGWDSSAYDHLTISLVSSGGTVTEIVGNSLGAYTTWPNSPASGANPADAAMPGYGHYNGYDMTTSGTHTAGMSVPYNAEPWWTRSVSLAAFAGQTVTLRISTANTEWFKTWFHIDDVEWSVVEGTLGPAQGFGVALTAPLGTLAPGQTFRVIASVDARPATAGTPVIADIFLPGGAVFQSGVVLYNDGAHGDGAAGDAVWASAPLTIPAGASSASGWTVRVQARDAGSSTLGAANNGLVHRTGQPTDPAMANWWNIDEASFAVAGAAITVGKSMTVLSDGINTGFFKALPGARLRYCITIANGGPAASGTIQGTDQLPAGLSYVPGTLRSGANCASAATDEDDDANGPDEEDPVGAGMAGTLLTINRPTLAASESFAITYEVLVD